MNTLGFTTQRLRAHANWSEKLEIPQENPILGRHIKFQHGKYRQMTKDELRNYLDSQVNRFEQVYGGEVVTYAAQPKPDRRAWKKRPNLLDKAFKAELEKEARRQQEEKSEALE